MLIFFFSYRLQNENDNLIGKYSVHSQQLQSEVINLPNTVDVSVILFFFIIIEFCVCFLRLGTARIALEIASGSNHS